MRRELVHVTLSLLFLLHGAALAQDRTSKGPKDNVSVKRDPKTFVTTIKIEAARGEVAWPDVLRGLARARGFDDASLEGLMPDSKFSLSGTGWLLTSAAMNAMLSPGIRFSVDKGETPGAEPSLIVKANREVILASERKFKDFFRKSVRRRASSRDFGLSMEEGWQDQPAKNVVIFVHGLESSSHALRDWVKVAKAEGFPCGAFQYPNDQAISKSAELLAEELHEFAAAHSDRRVSLVAHSMGGLVCRAVIEDSNEDPGNIRQLIMVATPNHGSNLAYFGFALEVASPIIDAQRQKKVGSFMAAMEDGLGEASEDLIPDSVFLGKLNRQRRNRNVEYSLFLGNQGLISESELVEMREQTVEQGAKNRWVRFFGSRAEKWLADLDEVVEGKGDGVVAVERSRLEGVDDTVVLKFGHMNVLEAPGKGDVAAVHRGITERLKRHENE